MYIPMLGEEEKRCFLELAHLAILADRQVFGSEEEVFQSYVIECELPDFRPSGRDVAEIVLALNQADQQTKRIVILELFGILLADSSYSDEEVKFVEDIAQRLGISAPDLRRMKRWALDFINVVEDGYRLVESR